MSSYPKGHKNDNYRASKRKRSFHGNQHTLKKGTNMLEAKSTDDIPIDHSRRYRIIEFMTIFSAMSEMLCCKKCKGKVKFQESLMRESGFCWKLAISCRCGSTSINTSPYINNEYEVDQRIVFTMRFLGVGLKGINLFAGLMDFGQGLSKGIYDRMIEYLCEASRMWFRKSCDNQIEEEEKSNGENSRQKVSEDLLKRCLNGDTQYTNKSLNALIWQIAPKHLNCGPKTIEIAGYIAGLLYNDGFTGILMLMKDLEFVLGTTVFNYAKNADEERAKRQNNRNDENMEPAGESELYEKGDSLLYGAVDA